MNSSVALTAALAAGLCALGADTYGRFQQRLLKLPTAAPAKAGTAAAAPAPAPPPAAPPPAAPPPR